MLARLTSYQKNLLEVYFIYLLFEDVCLVIVLITLTIIRKRGTRWLVKYVYSVEIYFQLDL